MVEEGKRVRLRVKLQVVDGDVIEKNIVEYFQGGGTMLPGIERLLDGCPVGTIKAGVLAAEDAFGDPQSQPTKTISRNEFPKDAELEAGTKFVAKDAEGKQDVVLQIESVDKEVVIVRLCHPLADKDIRYELEVLGVSDPNPPPLPSDALADDDDEDGADS